MSDLDTDATTRDRTIDAYKFEYQIVADRYENIYKAIWQHFQYMAALAAGIVAFGSKSARPPVVALIAGAPLLFWYYASYLPMDHYARSARRRATDIEGLLNDKLFPRTTAGTTDSTPAPATKPVASRFLATNSEKESTGISDRRAANWVRWAQIILPIVVFVTSCCFGLLAMTWITLIGTGCSILLHHKVGAATAPQTPGDIDPLRLQHFHGFGKDDPILHWGKGRGIPYPHVNQVVTSCFTLLAFIWIALIPDTYRYIESRSLQAARPAPDSVIVALHIPVPLVGHDGASGPVQGATIRGDVLDSILMLLVKRACAVQNGATPC